VTVNSVYERFFCDIVEKGGGIWVGIQDCPDHAWDLVLFNSPKTGSTLALKTNKISATAVREHIRKHNKEWKKLEHNK